MTVNDFRWHRKARILGFVNERQMFWCLLKEWSILAIADLISAGPADVTARLRALGIRTRMSHGRRCSY